MANDCGLCPITLELFCEQYGDPYCGIRGKYLAGELSSDEAIYHLMRHASPEQIAKVNELLDKHYPEVSNLFPRMPSEGPTDTAALDRLDAAAEKWKRNYLAAYTKGES